MFSPCTMFNSSIKVQFTTSSPFFANAMLVAAVFKNNALVGFVKTTKIKCLHSN